MSGVMSSKVEAIIFPIVFFFPPLGAATGLRSTLQVLTASTGRPSRTRITSTHGISASIRTITVRVTTTIATTGYLFVLSKGSLKSERSERTPFIGMRIPRIGLSKKQQIDEFSHGR